MPLVTIADLNNPDAPELITLARELAPLYDEYVNNEEDDSHKRTPGIHPSEFSACLRKVTYNLAGTEKKNVISKFWRQRFKVGHAIHDMVQADFDKLAKRTKRRGERASRHWATQVAQGQGWVLEFEREVRISPEFQKVAEELRLAGHCDGIFTFRERPHGPAVLRVGVEIKSESGPEFEKLKEPREDHVDQAHLYMGALDLPLMWFFYFSKGTQNNTKSEAPWLIPFNPAAWKEVEDRCRIALDFDARRELGPRQETIVCQFCPYAWTCQPAILQGGIGKPSKELVGLRVPKAG